MVNSRSGAAPAHRAAGRVADCGDHMAGLAVLGLCRRQRLPPGNHQLVVFLQEGRQIEARACMGQASGMGSWSQRVDGVVAGQTGGMAW